MVKLKGQFMVISAVIAGLIMISATSVISDVESQTFEPQDSQNQFIFLAEEAERIYEDGVITQVEEEKFRSILNTLEYSSQVEYGDNCLNLTLTNPSEEYRLECLGD